MIYFISYSKQEISLAMGSMRMMLLLGLCLVTLQMNLFGLELLNNKNGAVCLDGSPPAIYTYEPDDPEKAPNKLLIYFQWSPNGWCFKQDLSSSLNECLKWAENDFGSSNNYESNVMFLEGILSSMKDGEFTNWYKVIIKSCDGGSYIGNEDPISIKRQKLYFRGSKIMEEVITRLNKKGWLQNRDQIVLAGTFNGGVAAVHWSELFQRQTKNPIKVIVDAGYYLNDLNYKQNRTTIQNRMQSLSKIVLQKASMPHSRCAAAYPNEPWRCFFFQELVNLTSFPLFFAQALYDSFHIEEVLGFNCAEMFKSLSECPQKDREVIEMYKKKMQQILTQAVQKEGNGALGIACALHDMTGGKYQNQLFEVPMNSGNYLSKGLQAWMKGEKIVWIDSVDWPQNAPCAHKLSLKVDWK